MSDALRRPAASAQLWLLSKPTRYERALLALLPGGGRGASADRPLSRRGEAEGVVASLLREVSAECAAEAAVEAAVAEAVEAATAIMLSDAATEAADSIRNESVHSSMRDSFREASLAEDGSAETSQDQSQLHAGCVPVGGRVSLGAITPPLGLPLSPSPEACAQQLVSSVMVAALSASPEACAQELVSSVMAAACDSVLLVESVFGEAFANAAAHASVTAQSLVESVFNEAVAGTPAGASLKAQSLVESVFDEAVAGATARASVKAQALVLSVMDEAVAQMRGGASAAVPWRYPSAKTLGSSNSSKRSAEGPSAAAAPCDWPSEAELVELEALAARLQQAMPHEAAAATAAPAAAADTDHVRRLVGAVECIERCAGA